MMELSSKPRQIRPPPPHQKKKKNPSKRLYTLNKNPLGETG